MVLGTGRPPALAPARAVPRMVVSRTRPPDFVPVVAERLGAETVPMGSAGAKIAAVIRGEAEVYVHAGGQYEWDSAAPVAVALAMGLHASRLDGSPLRYSQPDPWLPDLVVCHPSLTDAVMAALAAADASGPGIAGAAGTAGDGDEAERRHRRATPARDRRSSGRPGSVPLTLKNRIIKSATFEGATPKGAGHRRPGGLPPAGGRRRAWP